MEEKALETLVRFVTFGYSQRGKKDRKVFDSLMGELPPDSPAIRFLDEHDMGDPFKYEIISPLHRVVEEWNRVDRIFLNKRIESKKAAFVESLRAFLDRFSERSGGEGNGFISIGMKDWEDRPKMIEYKSELNRLGTESFKRYNEFVGYAHKKLPV